MRILLDVDGVLADFVGLVLDYVQKNTGLSYNREAVDQWDCFASLGLHDHWPYFRNQCDELALCRSMRPLPGAAAFYAEVVRLAHARGGKVKVCTTPMTPSWLAQRAEWLIEFGVPLSHQKHMHSKEDLVGGWDVLVDDRAENCEAFEAAGGKAFCIATPYNENVATRRGAHAECIAWLRELAEAAP